MQLSQCSNIFSSLSLDFLIFSQRGLAFLKVFLWFQTFAYYNLKESEVRQIERIEENFLRKVLKTSKGCPIVQLYLELGHTPARLEIQKMRVLFFQYILQENDESTLKKLFNLQLEKPTRNDWASTVISDLKELQIDASCEEIRLM